jgi:hypothetical protein
MRIPTRAQVLSLAAAIALLAGCSGAGTSAIPPKPAPPQGGADALLSRAPTSILKAMGRLKNDAQTGHHYVAYYACPATGPIEYLSDYNNSVINVYRGKFAGQSPCGQITSGVSNPEGIYVQRGSRDLYVANDGAHDVLVFHRGKMTPYNTYTDPGGEDTFDVTVAGDGTVIASNLIKQTGPQRGSISTWRGGPHGGTFIGNFPMTNSNEGLFITVQKNGTVYFDDVDATSGRGLLWSVKCPAGACGTQKQVAGVSFNFPFGIGSDNAEDVLVDDLNTTLTTGTANTFELPNPHPKSFTLVGVPVGMAIDALDHHWFVADAKTNDAAEYSYPGGALVGTVPGNSGGDPVGIAVDPGHALK